MNDCVVEKLEPSAFFQSPVWEFILPSISPEGSSIAPVLELPVENLVNRLVGTKILLNNSTFFDGMVGNIDVVNPELNRHFLTVSIWIDGAWFHLHVTTTLNTKNLAKRHLHIGLNF